MPSALCCNFFFNGQNNCPKTKESKPYSLWSGWQDQASATTEVPPRAGYILSDRTRRRSPQLTDDLYLLSAQSKRPAGAESCAGVKTKGKNRPVGLFSHIVIKYF